jgi:phosphate:Na+ symporter
MQLASSLIGGVGLFLLGMILLTDGLKAAAGDALRRWLTDFTGGPLKALLSGAGITALVQSSSATTLATIGFVSAGLLTFPQAVGVVFGANLGTTTTGWIVSVLGLKLQLSVLALPMVGAGVVLKLTTRGRRASLGMAVAGFGLLFVGIDALQSGMRDLAGRLDPAALPGDTVLGRLVLVAIGAAMTVVMQSSSAALATTLAALDARTIDLDRGAVLVIGQNLGTTVTAALAAVGASVAAKRTAAAHIGFNVITGAVALAVLPLLLSAIAVVRDDPGGPATLAAFHTLFNLLGVMLLFPVIDRFANTITRLIPERVARVTRNLDASVAAVPAVAHEAVRRTLIEIMAVTVETLRGGIALEESDTDRPVQMELLSQALIDTRRFAATAGPASDSPLDRARYLSLFHALDHLDRLVAACSELATVDARERPGLRGAREMLVRGLDTAIDWLRLGTDPAPTETLGSLSTALAENRSEHRRALLERIAFQQESAEAAVAELAAMQWIERVGYHLWRAVHHLRETAPEPQITLDSALGEADETSPVTTSGTRER